MNVLSQSDFVLLAMPLSRETRGIIGSSQSAAIILLRTTVTGLCEPNHFSTLCAIRYRGCVIASTTNPVFTQIQ